MSGVFPASLDFAEVTPVSNWQTFVSPAHSGKFYKREFSGHRFSFNLSFVGMTRDEFETLNAFLNSQHGAYGDFLITLPHKATPRGIGTGSPLVNGANQTGTTLITDGWTASQTGIMKAGDPINIAGDTKVYEIQADANSDGSGNATFTIYPALMRSPADNAVITASGVQYQVFAEDVFSYAVRPGLFYDVNLKVTEVY